ncbi:MAG: D-xylose transport system permease protein [Blastocatellia bacterium]|jgi:D-xylose transport system permease protein|nr:D-xylose transport system permease protein [Blastocatellia bacterium]
MSEQGPANEPPINRPPVVADVVPPAADVAGASQIRIGGFKIPTATLRAYTMVFALIVIWAVFHYTTNQTFLGPRNLSNLLKQSSVTGVLAVGMLMVIVAGQIDLSVGSVVGLAGGIAAMMQGRGVLFSLGSAIVVGLVIGALHGALVAYVNIPAFIVTLGGMLAWAGVTLGLMKGETITLTLPPFRAIGEGFIAPQLGTALAVLSIAAIAWFNLRGNSARRRHNLATSGLGVTIARIAAPSIVIALFIYLMNKQDGVPIPVLIMLAVAVAGAFVTQNTTFGRYLYAIGGNPDAARLSGISLRRHILSAFCIMGALAGLAALIHTARQGSAAPEAGKLMELDAIAACVIGGTSLMGGRGTVFGAILGALIMASLDNGMSLLNFQSYVQPMVKGMVLVAAVGFDMLSRKQG